MPSTNTSGIRFTENTSSEEMITLALSRLTGAEAQNQGLASMLSSPSSQPRPGERASTTSLGMMALARQLNPTVPIPPVQSHPQVRSQGDSGQTETQPLRVNVDDRRLGKGPQKQLCEPTNGQGDTPIECVPRYPTLDQKPHRQPLGKSPSINTLPEPRQAEKVTLPAKDVLLTGQRRSLEGDLTATLVTISDDDDASDLDQERATTQPGSHQAKKRPFTQQHSKCCKHRKISKHTTQLQRTLTSLEKALRSLPLSQAHSSLSIDRLKTQVAIKALGLRVAQHEFLPLVCDVVSTNPVELRSSAYNGDVLPCDPNLKFFGVEKSMVKSRSLNLSETWRAIKLAWLSTRMVVPYESFAVDFAVNSSGLDELPIYMDVYCGFRPVSVNQSRYVFEMSPPVYDEDKEDCQKRWIRSNPFYFMKPAEAREYMAIIHRVCRLGIMEAIGKEDVGTPIWSDDIFLNVGAMRRVVCVFKPRHCGVWYQFNPVYVKQIPYFHKTWHKAISVAEKKSARNRSSRIDLRPWRRRGLDNGTTQGREHVVEVKKEGPPTR
ncbi:hypothetical protein DICA4_E00892 [Diutina catenulata]